MGRARPAIVFKRDLLFNDWYELGPMMITDGIFRGSFPSGHTAAVFMFVTLAYICSHACPAGWARRIMVLGIWLGACSYALAMIIGRTMTWSHWIADGLIVMILNGWLIHLLFYYILKIPQQTEYISTCKQLPRLKPFWELWVCAYLLLTALGAVLIAFGLRAVGVVAAPLSAALLFPGIFLAAWFAPKIWQSYRRAIGAFTLPSPVQ